MDDLNNIKLPDNIDSLTANAISRGEKYKKKTVYRKVLATSLSICLFLTLGMTSFGASAKVMDFAGNVFEELKEIIGLRGGNEATKAINETVIDNKVSLTLQEVLCDEYGVYVSFVVRSEKPFSNTKDTQLLLYDDYAKVSFNNVNLDNGGKAGIEGKFIDKNTFIGVESYLFKDLKGEVPKNFNLDINIGAIALNTVHDNNIVRGNWKFSVPVSLNGEGVKVITPSIKHNNISIRKVTLSKLNTFMEIEMPSGLKEQEVSLFTDKGVEIEGISTEINESNGKALIKERFKGIPDDTESLIINFGTKGNIEVSIK
jgi:Domain of unknown function (DUF4179)